MSYNGENSFIIGNRGSIDYCDNPYEELSEPVLKRCQACDHWEDVEEMTEGYCSECWNCEP